MHRADLSLHRARGVTLIEMIVAMVVLGILIGVVGMFVRNQVTSYFDVAARTELSDAADSALRRISRELQAALPNSVRVSADSLTLEFVPIRDAGRYRAQRGVPADNHLDFASTTDNSFEVFGPAVTAVNGDSLVVYNLGIPGADFDIEIHLGAGAYVCGEESALIESLEASAAHHATARPSR